MCTYAIRLAALSRKGLSLQRLAESLEACLKAVASYDYEQTCHGRLLSSPPLTLLGSMAGSLYVPAVQVLAMHI